MCKCYRDCCLVYTCVIPASWEPLPYEGIQPAFKWHKGVSKGHTVHTKSCTCEMFKYGDTLCECPPYDHQDPSYWDYYSDSFTDCASDSVESDDKGDW